MTTLRAVYPAVIAIAILSASCGDSGPSEPAGDERGPILILGDGGTEDSVAAILTRAGIPVVMAGPYWEYDGAGLDDASALVLLLGLEYDNAIPLAVQQQIVSFVGGGGGLMTTEWLLYNAAESETPLQAAIAAIAPAIYGGDYMDTGEPGDGLETYSVQAPEHPVAAGLPASFTTPELDWTWSITHADEADEKQAEVIFLGSESHDAVVAGRFGVGRTVHWNMGGHWIGDEIWTPHVRTLLENVARYISGRT